MGGGGAFSKSFAWTQPENVAGSLRLIFAHHTTRFPVLIVFRHQTNSCTKRGLKNTLFCVQISIILIDREQSSVDEM